MRRTASIGVCAAAFVLSLGAFSTRSAAAHTTDFGHALLTISPTTGSPGTGISATYMFHPKRGDSCPSGTIFFFWEGTVQGQYPLNVSTCSVSTAMSVPVTAPTGDYHVCGAAPPFPACAVFSVRASSATLPAQGSGFAAGPGASQKSTRAVGSSRVQSGDDIWKIGALAVVGALALAGLVLTGVRFSGTKSPQPKRIRVGRPLRRRRAKIDREQC
jgi:hypothetical protein